MKVGFDISQTGAAKAGCGFFAAVMIRELIKLASNNNKYVLYPSFGDFYFDPTVASQWEIGEPGFTYGPVHESLDGARQFWNAAEMEQNLGDVEVIHSNNYWCPRQLREARLVYTLYDLSFLEEPAWTTEANRIGCFHGVFGAATAADWIISISQASRDHFLTVFPSFPPDRISVIFPGSRFAASSPGIRRSKGLDGIQPGRYFLSVGTIEPRKNHDRLLQAFAGYLAAGGRPMHLVLAGGPGWLMGDLSARLAELNITEHVVETGYVSDEELVWLYKNCHVNIYVSLFEGFGLPVLEGMTLGAATVASRSTSIPEITGDAAILVDPLNVDELTKALLQISKDQDLQRALSNNGIERAKLFQWEHGAQQLIAVYQAALDAPQTSH